MQKNKSQLITDMGEISSIRTYKVNETQTLRDLLKELNLESNYFAILVDGKRISLDEEVKADSEITILPKIAGG